MPKLTPQEQLVILNRRKEVAEGYFRRESQYAIADRLGVDRSTVVRDLAWVRKEWLASSLQDFDARKAEELARIDQLERVALAAWERSCQNAEATQESVTTGLVAKTGGPLPPVTKTTKTSKGQAGDPRFLERVAWCIDQRCKIFGLVVRKNAMTDPDGKALQPPGELLAIMAQYAALFNGPDVPGLSSTDGGQQSVHSALSDAAPGGLSHPA